MTWRKWTGATQCEGTTLTEVLKWTMGIEIWSGLFHVLCEWTSLGLRAELCSFFLSSPLQHLRLNSHAVGPFCLLWRASSPRHERTDWRRDSAEVGDRSVGKKSKVKLGGKDGNWSWDPKFSWSFSARCSHFSSIQSNTEPKSQRGRKQNRWKRREK